MSATFEHVRAMDAVAVRQSVELVQKASTQDLSLPTPCSGWTLRDLLAHMTAQHRGFAAAAAGNRADLGQWEVRPLGDDAVTVYASTADEVLAAFASVTTADARFVLPEFPVATGFPARLAIGFHLIDYLVHSWDVAASLGVPFEPDPELVEVGLPIALAVPQGEARLASGNAFQPVLEPPDGAGDMDRILAVLGRSPAWHA